MPDYPDYTRAHQIIGSGIMVPIDIQGAYIMMPIDIQAQYIDLAIDIVAQTIGNIAVNIAAASIGNIGIDIKAAAIGNLGINVAAQNIGIQLQPDWQTLQGNDKTFRCVGDDVSFGDASNTDYEVPAGKTLYITHASFAIVASAAADADKPQHGKMILMNFTDTEFYGELGGDGGGALSFVVPIAIPTGKTFRIAVQSFANHTVDIIADCEGYEI